MREMITRFMPAFLALVLLSGCATPYMANRKRDAMDIVTATVGGGAGGKVRAGPLQLGLMLNLAEAGLRGGEIVKPEAIETSDSGLSKSMEGLYFAYGLETFNGGPLAPERGKSFHAITVAMLTAPIPESILFGPKPRWPSGVHAKYNPIAYWTQVEAAIGIGGTVRLGFNFGELVDFILGWTTLDIFMDDIEGKTNRPTESTSSDEPAPSAPPSES